jgi:LacI family transcriptional regulator
LNAKPRKRVTLKDVANVLGISVSTVSRALDPKSRHNVAAKLAEQIQTTSLKLGYRPNVAAYSLKTNKTRTVGVVVPDITDPAFSHLIRGVERGLESHNYIALLANTDDDSQREEQTIGALNDRGVDGFILASVRRAGLPASSRLGKPIVTVNRTTDDRRIPCVVHDQAEGVRRLVTHLVSLGHRRIACIAGPQDISTGFERYRAFTRQRDALDIGNDKRLIAFASNFSEAEGERCAEELFARKTPFTAVVCANDRLAIGALVALKRKGFDCPKDVSVTGINDMPLADRMDPPLTTVRMQHFQAGVVSAELILDLMDSDGRMPDQKRIVLPVEMVVRGSTGVAPRLIKGLRSAATKTAG